MARGKKAGAKTIAVKPVKAGPSIETTLWAAADKLRGNMDAAEYKHVALGLIFLKYISDRFEARMQKALDDPEERGLLAEPEYARDLFISDNVFYVPDRARWTFLKAHATSTKPTIGELIDQSRLRGSGQFSRFHK